MGKRGGISENIRGCPCSRELLSTPSRPRLFCGIHSPFLSCFLGLFRAIFCDHWIEILKGGDVLGRDGILLNFIFHFLFLFLFFFYFFLS